MLQLDEFKAAINRAPSMILVLTDLIDSPWAPSVLTCSMSDQ
jgi:hypothetical protein